MSPFSKLKVCILSFVLPTIWTARTVVNVERERDIIEVLSPIHEVDIKSQKRETGEKHNRYPPLVLFSRGCSGSTFLIHFAWKLVESHTGRGADLSGKTVGNYNFPPDGEYLATHKHPLNSRYNYSDTDKKRAHQEMVLTTYRLLTQPRLQDTNGTTATMIMAPKIIANAQLSAGTAWGLTQLESRYVMTYRRNILNQLVCMVKDCFGPPEMGVSVYKNNGTRISKQCMKRRENPAVKTQAKINTTHFDLHMRSLMKEYGCHKESLEDPRNQGILQQKLGLEPNQYVRLQEESLTAFEYYPEGSVEFGQSMLDWKRFLKEGWNIEPDETLILNEMRKAGIGTRLRASTKDKIYNFQSVKRVIENWAIDSAHDGSVCDWSWMIENSTV